MKRITKESEIPEIATFVSEALEEAGIDAVLSGGAAVTVYADNPYVTGDLDFVSSASQLKSKKSSRASGLGGTIKGALFTKRRIILLNFRRDPLPSEVKSSGSPLRSRLRSVE